MKSMYAQYLEEKTDDKIIETEEGFVTYRDIPDQNAVYIIDIYVHPKHRLNDVASKLAQKVIDLYRCDTGALMINKLIGSIVPSAKNSTDSLKVLLAYGMTLKSASENFIIFEKKL